MSKIKSLLISSRFAIAQREHKCKANSKHRIKNGDERFEIKNDRNWDKYCLECASKIIDKAQKDLEKLKPEKNSK
ncbi:hypothetical protein UA32_04775 [Photobacterium angustum]|uniref:Uncharacterized protein n=1 Tax=Photobacterium angustum TaxID=661 RepID=A0ABX5H3N5_PHOAN|nr:hypothetical protein [Photobacterium angustum]KJG39645.1 hypothetical protein UA32_04775 [Photobacterium angustum]PSX10378.1 hypothetical protein C0W27_10105 [Photobacterium angustum]